MKAFKEIVIILLLILAILLVLGVFLYDYIPMNKVVPKIEQYEAPNNVKQELQESIEDEQNTMQPIVYEINNSDLNLYERAKDYDKGKVNPFGNTTVEAGDNTTVSSGNQGGTTTTQTPTNDDTSSNPNSSTNKKPTGIK
ncbi:MAG: hypothetical protein HFJ26_05880 [Clostridia bacterium]|jgi:hypothetical protein|nr:hypothetical protein [Clostridia bacterium]